MGIDNRKLRAQAAALIWLGLAGAVHAAPDAREMQAPAVVGADGDRSAKTIELLLQMQNAAPASGQGARADGTGKVSAERRGAVRNEFQEAVAPVTENTAQPNASADPSADLPTAPARSRERAVVTTEPAANSDARDFLPMQVVRFLRENREIAIGAAVAILVLGAVAGAAAGAGGKKR